MNFSASMASGRLLRSLSLRTKIMVALILVSLFSIAGVSVVSLGISRGIILDNSEQMARNIVKQIAFNMDERVKSLEDTTYSIMQQTGMKLLFTAPEEDQTPRRQRELILSDAINQSPSLYRYVQYAFVENQYGERYLYNRNYNRNLDFTAEELAGKRDIITSGMDKQVPLRWMELDGELYFARLLVDQHDFSVHGVAIFAVNDAFLDFLDDQDILSKGNLIISSRDGILFRGDYDSGHPEVSSLLAGRWQYQSIASRSIDYEGQKILTTYMTTPKKNWRILCLIRAADLYRQDRLVILLDLAIAAAAFAVSILLTVVIVRTVTGNITRMEGCMTQVEAGDFSARIKPASYDEMGRLGLRFNYMVTQMEALIEAVAAERTSKQQAEFRALQAQVNPHFLYNTLGSIQWLANSRGEGEIEGMVRSLIALLKGSIRKSTSYQTVAEEVGYIENYIALQKMRYGEVFAMRCEIAPVILDAVIPGFLLQPIVENALFHGIDVAEETGVIVVRGFLRRGETDRVVLQVEDNGVGLSDERIREIMSRPKSYKGFNSIGVNLVHERLRACYGDQCSFAIRSEVGAGTVVEMVIPYATRPPERKEAEHDTDSDR